MNSYKNLLKALISLILMASYVRRFLVPTRCVTAIKLRKRTFIFNIIEVGWVRFLNVVRKRNPTTTPENVGLRCRASLDKLTQPTL